MFCRKCGQEMKEKQSKCEECGYEENLGKDIVNAASDMANNIKEKASENFSKLNDSIKDIDKDKINEMKETIKNINVKEAKLKKKIISCVVALIVVVGGLLIFNKTDNPEKVAEKFVNLYMKGHFNEASEIVYGEMSTAVMQLQLLDGEERRELLKETSDAKITDIVLISEDKNIAIVEVNTEVNTDWDKKEGSVILYLQKVDKEWKVIYLE